MLNQSSILQTKYLRWLRRFITARRMPDTIIAQQQTTQLMFWLFMLFVVTGFNLLLWIIMGEVTSFTLLGFVVSTGLYIGAYNLQYKVTAFITTLTALALPFILFIFSPEDLTIVAVIFLLVIALFISSQFLSFQSNLQIAILVIISIFFLNAVALPDSPVSLTTILAPSLIIVFASLLNAFGRRQMMRMFHSNGTPENPEFFTHSIEVIPNPVIIQVDKVIVVSNSSAARLIGIEKEALNGRNLTDFISTGSSTNYNIDHEADNLTIHYEDQLIQEGRDSTINVSVTARSIHYGGKLATLMILYPEMFRANKHSDTQSVTIRHEDIEATFRQIADMVSDYTFALDIEAGKVIGLSCLSGDYQTLLGLADDELKHLEDWERFIHEDDKSAYEQRQRALLEGEPATLKYRIVREDSTLSWIQDSAYPLYDAKREHVVRVLVMAMDVTEKIYSQDNIQTQIVQQAAVADLGLLTFNTSDLHELMQYIAMLCEQIVTRGFVAIFEYQPNNASLACVNLSRDDTPFEIGELIEDNHENSLLAHTLYTREIVISKNLTEETHFTALPSVTDAQYASALGIVIMASNNIPYGVLAVYSQLKHHFSPDETYFLQSIVNVASSFIEKKRAQKLERDHAEFTRALGEATAAINSRLELPEVLAKIIVYLQDVVPQTEQASIMLRDEDTNLYHHYITWGFPQYAPETNARFAFSPDDFSLLRLMILTRQPVNVPDITNDARWIMRETVYETRSYLASPIILDEDVIGFINLHAYKPSAFSEVDTTRLKIFADTVSTAIVNAQKQEDLERKVEQRTLELQQQSEQLSTILGATGDGIFYTRNNLIAFVNDAFCKLTGYSAEELQNQSSAILQPDDILPQELTKLQSITNVVARGEIWRDMVRFRRKDGSTFDAGLTISQVASADDETFRSVTIVRDMSKQQELEELKKTFIAAAAHDLRSPISSLQMRMHMIKHQPAKIDYHLERIDHIIERMNHLVNDLLDAHGRIVLRLQNIVLQEMLNLVVDILSAESELKEISFKYEAPSDPIMILADKHRLEQVFYNLITNAINYTDPGGRIAVSYKVDPVTETVRVEISDTGIGIAMDEQANVFLPFYRARKNNRKGSGLGLSITREIVELHNGNIELYSRIGKGSTFTVTLPVLTVE